MHFVILSGYLQFDLFQIELRKLLSRQHAILTNYLLAIGVIIDQVIVGPMLHIFNSMIGVDNTFLLWWSWHLLFFFVLHIIAPICMIYIATSSYPEFNGLQPRTFPDQQGPRRNIIVPRRLEDDKIFLYSAKTIIVSESA